MMVNKIILRDYCNKDFDDLITFEKDVLLKDVYDVIDYVKTNIEEYSNEDVYIALHDRFGDFDIEYIGQYEIVVY